MSENNSQPSAFSSTEILSLCDSIKELHLVLKTVGEFFSGISGLNDHNGNALLKDFKQWSIRMLTLEMLETQLANIERIQEIYQEEQDKISA